MSKAFTKESDGDEDDDLPEEMGGLPISAKNYMTPEGFARLRGELDTLMRKERPDVVKVVSWAAGNGDRSENGDYIYGKKRLREIDRRVRYLSKRLANAEVVDPAKRAKTVEASKAKSFGEFSSRLNQMFTRKPEQVKRKSSKA